MSACARAGWKRCGRSARAGRAFSARFAKWPERAITPAEDDMSDTVDDGKRGFLKHAALLGAASGALGAALAPEAALAQVLETGVREDSVLAKCRRDGALRVGD